MPSLAFQLQRARPVDLLGHNIAARSGPLLTRLPGPEPRRHLIEGRDGVDQVGAERLLLLRRLGVR